MFHKNQSSTNFKEINLWITFISSLHWNSLFLCQVHNVRNSILSLVRSPAASFCVFIAFLEDIDDWFFWKTATWGWSPGGRPIQFYNSWALMCVIGLENQLLISIHCCSPTLRILPLVEMFHKEILQKIDLNWNRNCRRAEK